MCEELRRYPQKFALFIDEYDSLVIRALHKQNFDEYWMLNDFFARFFSILKANKEYIPFQFITGSSRLAIKGFWSGPNNIKDLSYLPNAALALGYTWKDIEELYPTQLTWLSKLHNLKPEELQTKIEGWYDRHRWSPASSSHVFNPWSIHMLMQYGEFDTYWASSGTLSHLISSKLLVQSLLQSLLHDQITIDRSSLLDSRLPQEGDSQISIEAQKSLLVGAGILSIHPNFDSQTSKEENFSSIELTIPNLDAKEAIHRILQGAVTVSPSFLSNASALITDNDMIGLIDLMCKTNTLNDTLRYFKDPNQKLSEFHLSMAFSFLVVSAKTPHVIYRPEYPDKKKKITSGKPPHADHIFYFPSKNITHIMEFKVKSKSSSRTLLRDALQQSLKYYKFAKDGKALYSSFVFGHDAKLQLGTVPLSYQKAEELIDDLEKRTRGRLSHPSILKKNKFTLFPNC